ncbi:hypothetical protein TrRE_jg12405 [Triparma retinervis]|uniref:Glycoside hydrolase family 38 central domain-containing protein n=1 Tax=Triparma retinervis TaxID=2557542 RepID=A0A9W7CJQ7_9STRA|nr:hypothetical protein TrRE_jg12405 [Triparma retinervis]
MKFYFDDTVHNIYDTVLTALVEDESLKFSVAEIGFFRTWWEKATSTQRADFTRILGEKRFEFVGGGYSQPDEAANDGPALVRNMMNGHTWIAMTFGEEALPTVSWSLDPFGQTPTAMSLFKQMGFTDAVIDRIPFSTKDELVEEDSLEFFWRVREFNSPPTSDDLMFTHVLHAYYHLGRSGRYKPEVDRLYWGPQASDHTSSFLIDSIPRAALALASQITEQSEGQRHNKVMVLFGKDFAFQNATQEFSQMSPLVDWISEHGMKLDPPMRIKYATASEYFTAVRADSAPDLFPVIGQTPSTTTSTTTTSFIPYIFSGFISERMFGWWSGFFFSRPALKANARAADALLSAAETLSVTLGGVEDPVHLKKAIDISGLMTHHDALPGTSLTPVTADLYVQLREGATASVEIEESVTHSHHSDGLTDSGCSDGHMFVVSDDTTVLHFSSATGELCRVNGREASISYGAYTPLEDDPWVFRPRERPGEPPKRKFRRRATRVITGAPLVNYVVQELREEGREMHLSSRLLIGRKGGAVEVTHFVGNETNVISDESEVGVEFWVAGVAEDDGGVFMSDTNGISGGLQKRTIRDNLPLPANFFPIVRLATVGENTVMVSHTHAVSTLRPGGLMVMLHRRLARGGLFEGGIDFVNDPMQDTEIVVDKMLWNVGGRDDRVGEWTMQAELEEPVLVLGISLNLVLLLGSANVVPWLAYISVSDYWNAAFPNKQTSFIFPVLNMSLLAIGTIMTTLGGRNLGSLSKGWSLPALYANLSCLSLLVAVNQSSCYGLAGIMGPDFIQALERGKGWTGVAVVVLRAFIKCLDVGEGGAARTGGTGLFFLAASLIVCLATAGYGALTSQAYSKALVDEYEGNLKVHEATPRNTPLSTPDATAGRRRQGKGGGAGAEGATGAGLTRKVKNKILLRIQVPLLTIFLVFTLCISCFPGVATTLRSDTWGMGTWFPLAMVAAYNTADLLGKTLPSSHPSSSVS